MSGLSPAPGTPQTPDKAVAGGGVAGVITYIVLATFGTNIDAVDWKALAGAVLSAAGAALATYLKANKAKTTI